MWRILQALILLPGLWMVINSETSAQSAQTSVIPHVSHDVIETGGQFVVAIEMSMSDDWHTYWKNPGEAGMATKVQWEVPEFILPGPVQWPVPKRYGEGEFTTYGYGGVIRLLVPVIVKESAPAGEHSLSADVSWLECKELCVPGRSKITVKIVVGEETQKSGISSSIEEWGKAIPRSGDALKGAFQWTGGAGLEKRGFIASIPGLSDALLTRSPDFFPEGFENADVRIEHATRVIHDGPGETDSVLVFEGSIFKYDGSWPASISGLLVSKHAEDSQRNSGVPVQLESGEVSLALSDGAVVEEKKEESNDLFSQFGPGLGNGGISRGLDSVSPSSPSSPVVSVPSGIADVSTGQGAIAVADPANLGTSEGETPAKNYTNPGNAPPGPVTGVSSPADSDNQGGVVSRIVVPMAFAFLGGILLNFMPCVLPVVFLKIMSFVKMREESAGMIRKHGLFYLIGVLVCYLVLALVLVFLRESGRQMGFGFQFTSPYFIIAMTLMTALIALNLFGAFEIVISGKATTAASKMTGKAGLGGAFWGGCFTTLLGTPCMAPGLAVAAGFALAPTTPVWLMIATFLMMGVGLASPYVLASLFPGFIRILPKPGPWMVYFKMAMGFPMAAASIWLLTLTDIHYGTKGILWVGMFLICVAMAFWVLGTFIQRTSKGRGLGWAFVLIILGGGYLFTLENRLDWRNFRVAAGFEDKSESPATSNPAISELQQLLVNGSFDSSSVSDPKLAAVLEKLATSGAEDKPVWQPWDPEAIVEAQKAGQPVFIDFTATWCINCKENKKRAIDVAETQQLFAEKNVILMRGDYTRQPPEMTEELLRFGRAGVPLNLLYPADTDKDPIVLPTYLTKASMIEALENL